MRQTYTLIRRLAGLVGSGVVAAACGKTTETVDAWGRPPLSNDHPTGTGKHNPLDSTLRLQRLAYEGGDPDLAHDIARLFTDDITDCDRTNTDANDCLSRKVLADAVATDELVKALRDGQIDEAEQVRIRASVQKQINVLNTILAMTATVNGSRQLAKQAVAANGNGRARR